MPLLALALNRNHAPRKRSALSLRIDFTSASGGHFEDGQAISGGHFEAFVDKAAPPWDVSSRTVPLLATAVVPVVNINEVAADELVLSLGILRDVGRGAITRWDDERIVVLNKGCQHKLQNKVWLPVYRHARTHVYRHVYRHV